MAFQGFFGQFGLFAIQWLIFSIPDVDFYIVAKIKDYTLNIQKTEMRGYKILFWVFNFFMLFLMMFYYQLVKYGKKFKQYIKFYVIGIVVLNLSAPFGGLGGLRAAIFFFSPLLVLIPLFIQKNHVFSFMLSKCLFYGCCLFLMSYQLYASYVGFHFKGTRYNYYLPYKFFWETNEDQHRNSNF